MTTSTRTIRASPRRSESLGLRVSSVLDCSCGRDRSGSSRRAWFPVRRRAPGVDYAPGVAIGSATEAPPSGGRRAGPPGASGAPGVVRWELVVLALLTGAAAVLRFVAIGH